MKDSENASCGYENHIKEIGHESWCNIEGQYMHLIADLSEVVNELEHW